MMKTSHRFGLLLGGIVGFSMLNGCGAVDQPAGISHEDGVPEAVASNLSVELSIQTQSLTAHDDVQVTVTLTNIANHAVRVLNYHTVMNGIQDDLFTITRDGAPVQYIGRHYKRVAPRAIDYLTLGAGESLTNTVSLAGAYDLSGTGDYTINHAQELAHDDVTFSSNSVDLWIEGRANPLPEESLANGGDPLALAIPTSDQLNAMSTTNCTSTRASQISSAFSGAKVYANNAVTYLTNTTPGNTPRYKTWFGTYTSSRWSTVTTHYTNIRNAFNNQNVVVDCSCADSGTYAYVYPTQPYKIYVCGAFWSAPSTGTDSKAGTLLHEMSRFNVVASTDNWAYGQSACKSLAISNPSQAVDNADSHEYFAENNPALN